MFGNAIITPAMVFLLIGYWLIHRDERSKLVADGLAANWAVCQLAVMMNGGYATPAFFIAADFIAACWLVLRVQGWTARLAAFWYMPMIGINASVFAMENVPQWHHPFLFGLAWLQLLGVMMGVWGNGLLAFFDNTNRGVSNSFSRAANFLRGRK